MKDALETWRDTTERAAAWLRTVPDAAARIPYAPGKWSTKEVVGHSVDSAANNHQRFVRAQWSDDLLCPTYAQDEWVRTQRYLEAPWPELAELFGMYNQHLARVVEFMPPEVLTRPRAKHNLHIVGWQQVSEHDAVTLAWFIRDYVGHLQHHIRQIVPAHLVRPERSP